MDKGIIIIATGNAYYGNMAYNLAISIKAVEDIPVAVLYNGNALSHLSEAQQKLFDYRIEIDAPASCGAKLKAYDYTPFGKSLLLDADMLWLPEKKPSELFKELEALEFTGITEGTSDEPNGRYFFWADMDDIKKVYGVDCMYQWRTEVLYFKKSKKVAKIFKDAWKIFQKPKLKYKQYANGVPDELAINISTSMNDQAPHVDKWQPAYWPAMYEFRMPSEASTLYRHYYLLSVGGNMATENVQKFYNNLMKAQAYKLGLPHLFALQSKIYILPERRKN